MTITITENDHGFRLSMQPETVADTALLARLGMNAKSKTGVLDVCIYAGPKEITGDVMLLKRKDAKNVICRK